MTTAMRARHTARVLALMALTILITGLPAQRAAADEPLDTEAIDRFVDSYAQRHGLPGISIAVTKDGEPVHEYATGGDGTPLTARSPMAIASATKMITAFAVLQQVDAGKIGLDDRVADHLPAFKVGDPRGDAITVRQLLSHTSGLPNPVVVAPADSPQEYLQQLGSWQLSSDPGTAHLYSNANYHLAARLVEVLTDQSFAAYLEDQVFTPLGMHDTRYVNSVAGEPGADAGHITAYGTAFGLQEMTQLNGGAGGVISSAHDLARWLAMQQRGGVTADGTRMLSEDLVEESHRPQPGSPSGGLGWEHTQTADPARVGHDGTLTSYSSRGDLVPSSGYGVVVLLDSFTTTWSHPFSISTGIIDISEGDAAEVGAPVPTIVDAVLGLITIGVLALVVRGLLRSDRWVQRRREWPAWRFGLRLLPQLIMPVVAVGAFVVLPLLQNNTATAADVLGIWPAATILLLVSGVSGLALSTVRVVRRTSRPDNDPLFSER